MKEINLITKKITSGIDRINKLCHDQHIPSPPVQFIKIEVYDPVDGCIERLLCKSNSWVRNAYNILATSFLPAPLNAVSSTYGAGSLSIKGTSGTTRASSGSIPTINNSNIAYIYNSSADANYGIVVGTSDTAESFEHHNLQAKVAHGTGSGQLSHSAGAAPTVTYDSGAIKWSSVLQRNFTNNSGASITIKEIGIAYYIMYQPGGYFDNVLITRDVLASPITVANNQILTVTYTSEITLPA